MNFARKPSARTSKSHARCSDKHPSALPAPQGSRETMNPSNGTERLRSDAAGPPDTQASCQHFWPYRGRERDIRARRAGAETLLGQDPVAPVRSCFCTGSALGPPVPAPRCPGRPPLPPPAQLPRAAGSPTASGGVRPSVRPAPALPPSRPPAAEAAASHLSAEQDLSLGTGQKWRSAGSGGRCSVSGAVPSRPAVPCRAVPCRAVPCCGVVCRAVPCCALQRPARSGTGARVPANERRHVSAPWRAVLPAAVTPALARTALWGAEGEERARAQLGSEGPRVAALLTGLWGCRRRSARPSCPRERSFPGIEGLRRQEILRGPVPGAAAMASPPRAGGWGPQPPPLCSVRASA